MVDQIYPSLSLIAPFALLGGIILHLFNLRSVEEWAMKHIGMIVFGFSSSILLNFSLAETLMAFEFYFLVLSFYLFCNWKEFGLNIAIIGALLNLVVIILNGGTMPMALTPHDGESEIYKFIDSGTILPLLSDVIQIGYYRASVGDIFIMIGSLFFIFFQIRKIAARFINN